MKTLYLITDVYPYGNGEKTFLRPELDELCNHFDVKIISCGESSRMIDEEYLSDKNIQVIKYNKPKRTFFFLLANLIKTITTTVFWTEISEIFRKKEKTLRRIKTSFWFIFESISFKDWLKKHGVLDRSALYYTYWYYSHTLSLIMLKSEYGYKVISRAHGYDLHDAEAKGDRQCCKRYMDKSLDSLVFISQEGYDYYLSTNDITASNRHCLFHLGAPAPLVPESQLINDNRTVVFNIVSCGSMDKWKRTKVVIDTLSLIDDYEVSWTHFGTGILWDELTKYAEQKLRNKKNIKYTFRGFVDRAEIYKEYSENRYNCYILSSLLEGLPVSNMEAMANAIPIITTDVGGCSETIRGNGILLGAKPDAEEFKHAIDTIKFMSSEDFVLIRENALKLWHERFDVEKNMKLFSEHLCNLV